MLFAELVATSAQVGARTGRLEKVGLLADLFSRLSPDEIEIAVAFLSGSLRQGRIGVGGSVIRAASDVPAAPSPSLGLLEIDSGLARMALVSGAGSGAGKVEILRELFSRATEAERDFLIRLLFGELRQGALEGVLLDAVGRASHIPAASIRRAVMFAGSLGPVAHAALGEGESALTRFMLQPFQPVQPMLADSAADVEDALAELGEASLEYKLDGARIQVHKAGDEVRVYSRSLRDVTAAVPEVVAAAQALGSRTLVLDGEAIALRADRTPHPFQTTMRRFGRKLDVERLRAELPITPFFFDVLLADDQLVVDEPQSRRIALLDAIVPGDYAVPRLRTSSADEAARFGEAAVAAGHEGVMAKSPDGLYAAGRRGSAWLKVKRARTLDLVVLAAEWGHGRRHGTLSNLHLGARDAERGGFVMLGKTFKGMTDEMLAWQTTTLLGLELTRDAYVVHVRPELVVEIAFNEIQESAQYPGRLALRFARVKRYRTDKSAGESDTFASVQSMYSRITGLEPPPRV
jgi:DNA ligase-1